MSRSDKHRRQLARWAGLLAIGLTVVLAVAGSAFAQETTTTQLDDSQQKELDTLATQLRDSTLSVDQRKVYAGLLLNKDWAAAEDVLIAVLSGTDGGGRQAVAEALTANSEKPHSLRFVDPLLAALNDPGEPVRQAAMRALASYGDDNTVVQRLRAMLLDAGKPIRQRSGVVGAMANIPPSTRVIDALVAVLDDKDAELRKASLEAMNVLTGMDINDPAARRKWWQDNRKTSTLVLIWRQVQGMRRENRQLVKQAEKLEERLVEAVRSLFETTPPAQQGDLLQKLLADRQPAVRVLALNLMLDLSKGTAEIGEPLRAAALKALSDESSRVRAAAAYVAPFLGDAKPAVIDALLDAEAKETDLLARTRMIQALGHIQANKAIPRLLSLLQNSPERAVVIASAEAIGLIADRNRQLPQAEVKPVVDTLWECYQKLSENQSDNHEDLVRAMAAVADAKFAPAFLKNLPAEKAELRLVCVRGLGNLGPLPASQAALTAEIIDALVARLSAEPDFGVRRAVIAALAQHGPGRTQLEIVYRRTDPTVEPDKAVRTQAWDSLIAMLKQADKATQLNYIAQIEQNADSSAAGRLVELMRAIEPDTTKPPWTQVENVAFTERLGDALIKIRKPADAFQRYETLYKPLHADRGDRAQALAQKCLQALLDSRQMPAAIALVEARLPLADDTTRQVMLEMMVSRLGSMLSGNGNGNSAKEVADWAREFRTKLPAAFSTGPAADSLKAVEKQARDRIAGAASRPD